MLLLILVLFIPASLVSAATKTTADFTDLKDLDQATKAKFDALISAGIFNGFNDGTFGIKEEMNRAQFAKVAALIFGLDVNTDLKTSSFSDVKLDDPGNGYALPFIEAIKAAGITTGIGDGLFDPSGAVTKEQLATFLVRGLGKEADAMQSQGQGVPNSTVSGWAMPYVNYAFFAGLLPDDIGFDGRSNADRGLLATAAFATKTVVDPDLTVNEATLDANKELTIAFSSAVDPKTIKLSNIMINGNALSDELDSFELSEDGKTLKIKLRSGFYPGSAVNPIIEVTGIQSLFQKPLVKDDSPTELSVTNPPVYPIYYAPVASASMSVTSVTYTTFQSSPALLFGYYPEEPATAYVVFSTNELDDDSASNIKTLASDPSLTSNMHNVIACTFDLDGSSNGSIVSYGYLFTGLNHFYVYLEAGGKHSQVFYTQIDTST